MIFPEEIITEIVSTLARRRPVPRDILDPELPLWTPLWIDKSSKEALLTLCLTSRDCRRIAAPILFHNVEITGDAVSMKRRAIWLLHILDINNSDDTKKLQPTIARCIRYVAIRPQVFTSKWEKRRPIPTGHIDFATTYQNERFLALLDYLSESNEVTLRGLSLTAPTWVYNGTKRWIDLPASFRTSIRRLLRKSTLEVLNFSRINCLPDYLLNGSDIQALSVIGQWEPPRSIPSEAADDLALSKLPFPNLKFLQTDLHSEFMNAPNWSNNVLQEIKGICIVMDWDYDDILATYARFLATSSKTVEELHLSDVVFTGPTRPLHSAIGELHRLTRLTIAFSEIALDDTNMRHEILDTLSGRLEDWSCENLERLTLQLKTSSGYVHAFLGDTRRFLDCFDEVDNVLTSTKYPSLKGLRLEMSVTMEESDVIREDDLDLVERLRTHSQTHFSFCFRRLKAQGKEVVIEFSSGGISWLL
ncbi:hypothetical protein CVT24_008838 [Panaeolus cyanescens]|uniref:F-box domain-containing protein n=1 Tax=Panaeolus cyanescens TaxID=181874 RepID=A0A409VK99_9AGAR|nr:hypothetical protein CVT24_008838 [Panaeolus cyanescens]